MSISKNITEDTPLNRRQKLFADEYLIDLNATQAAIRAGYSTFTAKDIGAENLAKPHIRAYVDRAMAERSKRTGVNADRVLIELARIAFLVPTDLIDIETGTLKATASKDDMAAIQSVKVKTIPCKNGEIVEREIRLVDKNKTLDMLCRNLGMLDNRRSGNNGNDANGGNRDPKERESIAKAMDALTKDSAGAYPVDRLPSEVCGGSGGAEIVQDRTGEAQTDNGSSRS